MFGSKKIEEKCREKKNVGEKNEKKWKKIKNKFKINKLFFMLVQTHFTYLNSSKD